MSKNATTTAAAATQPGPRLYFAPQVAGEQSGGVSINVPETYTIDDAADTFSQSTYLLNPPEEQGQLVDNAGLVNSSQGILRDLGITASYVANNGGSPPGIDVTDYPPPGEPGSFALELAGQAGGLVQLVNQPAQPLVAATQCPNFAKPQSYQFITIPAALSPPNPSQYTAGLWDPTTETAYGSVDVVSSGTAVTFQNIQQSILPSEVSFNPEKTTEPSYPSASSVTGACGPTVFGNTTAVPGELVVNPSGSLQAIPYQATIGIGASGGLLVEDNNHFDLAANETGTPYENVLGAGTGAVGLPEPSSALSTSGILGAQYLGFVYGAGVYNVSATGWTSKLASFGSSNTPASCAALAASTGTLANGIYGGDFPRDDPGNRANCDLAIDLGTTASNNNSLYTGATVWVGGQYLQDSASTLYPAQTAFTKINAVVIAGQINGKYALLVIGVDTVQPWAIYLLQSN